jgi:hypothetical protein
VTKNAYTFHSVNRNWRTTDSKDFMETRRALHGEPPVTRNQRTASAPYRSMGSQGSITFPRRLDILRPSASRRSPSTTQLRYDVSSKSSVASAMSE